MTRTITFLAFSTMLALGAIIFTVLAWPDVVNASLKSADALPGILEARFSIGPEYMKWVRIFVSGSPIVMLGFFVVSRFMVASAVVLNDGKVGFLVSTVLFYALAVVCGYLLIIVLAVSTDVLINDLLWGAERVRNFLLGVIALEGYAGLVLQTLLTSHALLVIASIITARIALEATRLLFRD